MGVPRLLSAMAAAAGIVLVSAPLSPALAQTNMKISISIAQNSHQGVAIDTFAKEVEKRTNGRYKIQPFYSGALGAESPDFSEMHLAWFTFTGDDSFTTKPVDPLRDPVLDQDGSFWEAAALLSRRTGPVDTADCPYSDKRPTGHWSDYTPR